MRERREDSVEVRQVRVHGVAGTPPYRILGTRPKPILRSGGDVERRSKVFRAHDPVPEGFASLEAFQWSPFTSGNAQQAVNALFAPFLFVNVAGWMQRHRGPFRSGMVEGALRAAAMATTSFLVVGLTWALYLIPTQACAQLSAGVLDPSGLAKLRCRFTVQGAGANAIGIALSVLTGAGLAAWQWNKTRRRRPSPRSPSDELDWAARIDTVEASRNLSRLQLCHLFLALGVVASIWFAAEAALAGSKTRGAWNHAVSGAFTFSLVVIVFGCMLDVGSGLPKDWSDRGSSRRRIAGNLCSAAILVAGCVVAFCVLDPRVPNPTNFETSLLAQFDVVTVHVAPAVVALIILGVVAVADWRIEDRAAATEGFQALAILALSMLTGGALAAGLAFVALEVLGIGLIRSILGGNEHVALALPMTLLLFGTGAGGVVLSHLHGTARGVEAPMRAITTATRQSLGRLLVWLGVCQALAWSMALLWRAGFVPQIVVIFAFGVLVFSTVTVIVLILARGDGAQAKGSSRLARVALAFVAPALTVSLMVSLTPARVLDWVTLGLPLLLLLWLVSRSIFNVESRRGLAVLSDLAGFWPRSFHPLLPRPYAARAVRALADHLAEDSGTVVAAGHSQGSMLSLLAVHNLKCREMKHGPLALITYGSPFASMYRAGFPGEFSEENTMKLEDSVMAQLGARWVNLYRDTDPIGGPVPRAPTNVLVPDVGDLSVQNSGQGPVVGSKEVAAHSHYEDTAEFKEQAELLLDEVRLALKSRR